MLLRWRVKRDRTTTTNFRGGCGKLLIVLELVIEDHLLMMIKLFLVAFRYSAYAMI